LLVVLRRRNRIRRREVDGTGRHDWMVHRHPNVDEPGIASRCE
jgi:hypothetical protein